MALLIGGTEAACAVPVHGPGEHGMVFRPDGKGARRRHRLIDLIVLHWTGGEGPPERVYRTLRRKNLGIEFIVGRDGQVVQCCDPCAVDTWDAGRFNSRSIGIEVVCYGHRRFRALVPKAGRDRPHYMTRLHGRRLMLANYYPEQMRSVIALVDALTDALPAIPRRVPLEPDGSPVLRELAREEADATAGVVGHFHLTARKLDPGPVPLCLVQRHWEASP